MAVRYEKETGDIVWDGFENGIGTSPHKGIAIIQNGNIATEPGEVMASYGRVQQSQSGTVASIQTATAISTVRLSTAFNILNGTQITITASTVSGLSTGNYFVTNSGGGIFQLGTIQTSGFGGGISWAGSSGSISFHITTAMSRPIASAIEPYQLTTTQQYRYYILDAAGLVWVYDTALVNNFVTGQLFWYLPNADTTYYSGGSIPSGIAVLNGWLMVFGGATIYCKKTVDLTAGYANFINGGMSTLATSLIPHFAYVGHQGKCYYTDGTYIGSIFPNTSLLVTGLPNIQSYCNYTAVTVTGTVATVINGSLPTNGLPTGSGGLRVPAVFFTDVNGTQPANLVAGTVYYIEMNNGVLSFQVFAASTGGSAIDIASGASGNQYFNTFFPVSSGGATTMTYSPQRLNLPSFEIAQCMTEIGDTIIVGTSGDTLYPWNQIDPRFGPIISLPERNTASLVNANNMAYAFVGNKGNIYITNGTVASLVIKVPDYCAGIPGTASTYIEPYFSWGGSAYIRGRIYFSILDQTATKVGNCGGIWSFVPTQNFYVGQDTGLALRLENQNSYGTYSGVAPVIIASQTQNAIAPQYWTGWYSDISSPTYGIDFTATTPVGTTVIDLDIVETGTILGDQKQTFQNFEYKLAAPLAAGESIAINYRVTAAAAWASAGTVNTESSTEMAGYVDQLTFEKTQWIQPQLVLTPLTNSSSFVRLTELRLRRKI